ncbi:hypothetical protein IJT93_01060, partial [bacterium]|nr:hypothetical protein [bacterium]
MKRSLTKVTAGSRRRPRRVYFRGRVLSARPADYGLPGEAKNHSKKLEKNLATPLTQAGEGANILERFNENHKNNLTTVEIIENESNFERENTKILTQNFQALEEALRILNAVSKAEIR